MPFGWHQALGLVQALYRVLCCVSWTRGNSTWTMKQVQARSGAGVTHQ